MYIYTIIIIILIIILFIYNLKKNTYNKTLDFFNYDTNDMVLYYKEICDTPPEIFTYDSMIKGPTILMVGVTHGNEPAGYYIIKGLMDKLNNKEIVLKKGKLILIPIVNYCGFKHNTRNRIGFDDINRDYHDKTKSIINKTVIEQVKKSDCIIDFHEGWGFYKKNNSSIGSTISPSNTFDSINIAIKMKDNINNITDDNNNKFIIRTNNTDLLKNTNEYVSRTEINGSLSHYAELLNKNYILIETSGQENIQPLDIRVNQGHVFINTLFSYYEL
jgi:hypothetical protein